MPAKPTWLARLPQAQAELAALPTPWVDRATLERVLGIGKRRAHQLLAPVAERRIGSSLVADREKLLAHLARVASGDDRHYEERRQARLWDQLRRLAAAEREAPPVWVAAPTSLIAAVAQQGLAGLPPGVTLAPGRITVAFDAPGQALEKLLALAVAIGRNPEAFEERVACPPPPP